MSNLGLVFSQSFSIRRRGLNSVQMKRYTMQKHFTLLAILTLLLSFAVEPFAQSAGGIIAGTVTLPSVQTVRATARGNLYRSRLSPGLSGTTGTQTTASSAYEDVIVSAHPLTFKPKVEPIQGAKIIQKDATFIPRVLPVTQGTVVEIVNADPHSTIMFLH